MTPLSFVLEAFLAVLLVACLYYCWRLEKKLTALRQGQDGVRAAAAELARATQQAEEAVRDMRRAAQDAGDELQSRIDDARVASDRLARAGTRR